MIDTNSEAHYEYLSILNEFDFEQNSNWLYFIQYLHKHRKRIQNIFDKPMVSFCLQKPKSQGALSLPFGQGSLRLCTNKPATSELFVIKDNGQVFCYIKFDSLLLYIVTYDWFAIDNDQRRHLS